jgi:hypothetical protein
MKDIMRDELRASKIVDRSSLKAELDALRVREKAHTREGDAFAAAPTALHGRGARVLTPLTEPARLAPAAGSALEVDQSDGARKGGVES